jgi:ubiquinone/menaquinone biosynthesis C-methylase UbiE
MSKNNVFEVQAKLYNNRWTKLYNISAFLRYTTASPLRVLRKALKDYGFLDLPNQKVFEFGFGHGHALFSFSTSSALYGVELSETAIIEAKKRACKRGYRNYEFKKTNSEKIYIDFQQNYFDIVLCSHVIEHVSCDEALIAELYRVTRPGGYIFLLAPLDIHFTEGILSKEQRLNPDFPERSFHVWRYNLATLKDLINRVGFKVIQASAIDAIWDWRESWPRAIQIVTSLLFVITPYKVWEFLDHIAILKGYHPKQGLIIAQK